LLDFNSLYPSIIQEYNLCFTTINWTKHMGEIADKDAGAGSKGLAPLPDSGSAPGILPRVIKTLVDRRRVVKDLLKKERDPVQKQQLDIRQKALKLTANSMYGC
ncbi:DNA polymerase alpha, partial [Ochromonadaceae sp. CCMP2298]